MQQESVALAGLGFASLTVAALVMIYSVVMFRLRANRIHVSDVCVLLWALQRQSGRMGYGTTRYQVLLWALQQLPILQ